MVLLQHGLFTFGKTARESYDRMIALVQEAELYIQKFSECAPYHIQSRSATPVKVAVLLSDDFIEFAQPHSSDARDVDDLVCV